MDLITEMESGPARQKLGRFDSHQITTDAGEDSNSFSDRQQPFSNHRAAALALLNGGNRLTRKAGSFCGQLAVDPTPMSDAQGDWLDVLLDRAGLPRLVHGGGDD